MKCRLLYAKTIMDPNHPEDGKVVPAGTIMDNPAAFWLCRTHQWMLRRLTAEQFDLITMDGQQGHALKYEAEPADDECLQECIRRGWCKPDYVLKPDTTTVSALE